VETALHDIVRNIPHVLIIWLALVALTLIGCGFLAVPTLQRRYRAGKARAAGAQVRRVQLGAQAEELRRLADELAVAAARSRVTTQRQEDEWEGLCRAREAAWRAYAAADSTARRVSRAVAFPLAPQRLDATERRARERYLHRVATEAYRRGEISVADLSAVLSRRGDWHPERHPADHEVALRRIARERLRAAYQAVAAIEQTARQQAEVADAAARSLQAEAVTAAARAHWAEEALAAVTGGHRRRHAVALRRRSVLAAG